MEETDAAEAQAAAPALAALPGAAGALLIRAGSVVLDFLLPPRCPACRARTAHGPGLCAACWDALEFIEPPLCPRTGRPFIYDPGPGIVSAAALARDCAIARSRAAARFSEVSRRMVHGLKYNDRHELAPLIAGLMQRAGAGLVADADLIVPVPLHRLRLWQRRYNQSALLAKRIARGAGVPCDMGALLRVRSTRAQVGLNWTERKRNVRKAFAVPEGARERIAGRRILLIDDVTTTGATAEACATALLDADAASVDLLAFAMVCDPVSPQA